MVSDTLIIIMETEGSQTTLGQKIRRLDVFKKVSTDFSEGSNVGGCISILATLAIAFFIYSEVMMFLYPVYHSSIDHNKPFTREQMMINLDIQFPKFPCELLSLDLQDNMLSHHPNIASVKKFRLDAQGKPIERSDFQILKESNPFEQLQMVKTALKNKYGCRIMGSFTVKEVPGNFHISSHAYEPNYVRMIMQGQFTGLDVSHIIHRLDFGNVSPSRIYRQHPDAELMRLQGHSRIYPDDGIFYTSHYHLSIVPTTYRHILGSSKTYQYTWNHNSYPTVGAGEMAALYFVYEIEGVTVDVRPARSTIFYFFFDLACIIGGIYALAMFLDRIMYSICGKPAGYELVQ